MPFGADRPGGGAVGERRERGVRVDAATGERIRQGDRDRLRRQHDAERPEEWTGEGEGALHVRDGGEFRILLHAITLTKYVRGKFGRYH